MNTLVEKNIICTHLGIKIGTGCNLSCKGCLDSVHPMQPNIQAIIKRLSSFDLSNCKNISFTGGEPLLYTDEISFIH